MTTLTAATPAYGSSIMPGPFPRPGSQGGGAAPTFSGQDVVRALRERAVMIIFIWLFFSGLAVAGTLYKRSVDPEYQAQAYIRVDSLAPPDPEDLLRRDSASTPADVERELQNQTLIVKSPEVLVAVLDDPELRRTNWFKDAERRSKAKNEKMSDLLLDVLSVSPVANTNFLLVSASWRDKKEVPIIVNVVVQQYVALVERRQKRTVNIAKEQLTAEIERTNKFLKEKKDEIENFQNSNDFSDAVLQQAQENVLTNSAIYTEMDLEVSGRKAQWESLQNVRPEDMPITPDLQEQLNSDLTLNQLQQRLFGAQQIFDQASQRFGPNHRVVVEAKRNYESAAREFSQERASKIVGIRMRQIEQAKRNYYEAKSQLLMLQEKMIAATNERHDKERKKARYDALLEERDSQLNRYEQQVKQKEQLDIIYRANKTVQIGIESSAVEPERMSSPDLLVWIPGGTMFGLFFAVGVAMLLELADKSVRTPRDVIRAHLPVLGTIPTTDDDEVEIERVESACLDAPHSVVAEAFRNLRANLFFSAPAEQQGVILVTSPSGGNGKTTIASNLAISIALSGRRVLLIDSNFRRPALPRIFANMRGEGLSNILIGQGELNDYVTRTNVPGLDVMSSGPLPPNPAELLGSSYLRDVVIDARSRYDQVIFDGPPVLLVSDAMVLAGAVDGVLLVCEYRSTLRGALQRTQSNLEAINVRIFGAVLNKVQSRAGGYFRKQYREFYEYHEAEDDAPPPSARLDAKRSDMGPDDQPRPRNGGPRNGGGGEQSYAGTTAQLASETSPHDSDVAVDVPDEPIVESNIEDDEPPMAATIDEYDAMADDAVQPLFRDVGDPPAPPPATEIESETISGPAGTETDVSDSGVIPDMKDVEDLDDFDYPAASPMSSGSPTTTTEVHWSERGETDRFDDAAPVTPDRVDETPPADEPIDRADGESPVEIDDAMLSDEEEIVIGEDEDEADLTTMDEATLAEEPSALDTPEALDAPPPSAYPRPDETPPKMLADDSAFDMLEDEIDLGDDLADLDSEEFRIDDKWDLDDDFEDPESNKPKS